MTKGKTIWVMLIGKQHAHCNSSDVHHLQVTVEHGFHIYGQMYAGMTVFVHQTIHFFARQVSGNKRPQMHHHNKTGSDRMIS